MEKSLLYKKCEEKIESQSKLIDSLKIRIEELEVNSIIKNQETRKLEKEFNDFKKQVESILTVSSLNNNNNMNMNMNNMNNMNTFDRNNISFISKINIFVRNRQIHNKVTTIIKNVTKSRNRKMAFYYLFNEFTINDFLEYKKSSLFYSLDEDSKKYLLTIGMESKH